MPPAYRRAPPAAPKQRQGSPLGFPWPRQTCQELKAGRVSGVAACCTLAARPHRDNGPGAHDRASQDQQGGNSAGSHPQDTPRTHIDLILAVQLQHRLKEVWAVPQNWLGTRAMLFCKQRSRGGLEMQPRQWRSMPPRSNCRARRGRPKPGQGEHGAPSGLASSHRTRVTKKRRWGP